MTHTYTRTSSHVVTCTRRIQFCAGHRVMGHENKCAHLHGHNYVVFLHAYAPSLDGVGRVIDFSVLTARIGGWIDRELDHGLILCKNDVHLIAMIKELGFVGEVGYFSQKLYTMTHNPTAEHLAKEILIVGNRLLEERVSIAEGPPDAKLYKVVVWETENCFATVEQEIVTDGKPLSLS